MIAGEQEVPADQKEIAAAIARSDAAIPPGWKNREGVDRRQCQVAGKAERSPTRQHEAVPRLQAHRVGDAIHGQPTLAGNHGVAFDAFMLGELDGPFSTGIEAAGHIAARFQQRQHIGKGVHRYAGRLRR